MSSDRSNSETAIMAEKGGSSSQRADAPPAIIQQGRNAMAAASAAEGDTQDPIHHHRMRHHTLYDNQPVEEVPPPPYDADDYGKLDINQNGLDTGAEVARDGRVNIRIKEKGRKVQDILGPLLARYSDVKSRPDPHPEPEIPAGLGEVDGKPPPPMNIVIQIVGSRGDVQPFIALGKVLREKYDHRVRIATHPTFRQFVTDNGLEFFSIGGDPAELMAFMVKNPGLMPGIESLKAGDIGKRRKNIYEMLNGCWRSCIEPGDGTGVAASDATLHESSFDSAISLGNDARPFVADAVIANPVSFAHIHVAEKLGIPLHLMFTMPWSPTQAFPHPLANILSANTDQGLANYVSYALVDMLTWQGLGDLMNKFRERVLHLEPVSIIWAPGMLSRLKIPYTYCWSPALIPKPRDWNRHIDISGFFFLNLATNYTPPPDLAAFLEAGPPPVYIGFGSIVVDDPNAMTTMIFEAVRKTGQRALVSKGWGGLGADELGIPEGVFMLGNCPHDWLFTKVSCVVHHGGAGTTAAGIAAGRPTVVVPFFGDQPFWGAMTAKAGAGPMPTPYKDLTADKLAESIQEALKPSSLERAAELSNKIKAEDGAATGAQSFHKQVLRNPIRCSLCPNRVAVWRVRRTDIQLSPFAATVLGNAGMIEFDDLKLYRSCEYDVDEGPPEPITGGASALIGTLSEIGAGVADMPVEILRAMKFEDHKKKAAANADSTGSSTPNENSTALTTARTNSTTSFQSGKGKGPAITDEGPTSPGSSSMKERSGRSMASIMGPEGSIRRSLSRSRSRNNSPNRSQSNIGRSASPCPTGQQVQQVGLDSILGAAKASGKIVKTGMKSPMDFTMSLAQGFHNAPKLYGDTTVRKQDRVTDLSSGLRAAGKEFGYGFYDGITGLVTQPIQGARKEGAAGFAKGLARGAFGLVLKPGASIWGLPGYTFKGIYMELTKHMGSSTRNYIIAARTAQGFEEFKAATTRDKDEVLAAWKTGKLQKKRGSKKYGKEKKEEIESHIMHPTKSNNHQELVHGFKNTRNLSFDERKELDKRRQAAKKEERDRKKFGKGGSISSYPHVDDRRGSSQSQIAPMSSADLLAANEADFEEAIKRSVTQTSRGNPQEDTIIERAIRASVKSLRNNPEPITDENQHQAYQRAVQASVDEADRARRDLAQAQSEGTADRSVEDEKAALARALTESLNDYHGRSDSPPHYNDMDKSSIMMHDNDHNDTDDDEDFRRAMQASVSGTHKGARSIPHRQEVGIVDDDDEVKKAIAASMASPGWHDMHVHDDLDDEMKRALTLSEQESKQKQSELDKQRTEEDIVMEYIKKQSLMEEEHRKKMHQ